VTEGIVSLHAHVERLFLLVLLQDLPAVGGTPQGTQGMAFLAMLFSLGWAVSGCFMLRALPPQPVTPLSPEYEQGISCYLPSLLVVCSAVTSTPEPILPVTHAQVRRLALALVRTFWGPASPQAKAVEAELEGEARWRADDELLSAAQTVMCLAEAACSPRTGSSGSGGGSGCGSGSGSSDSHA
jgi:hypothetical protein